jgi:prepilin-type N-terminal cleavage/methylation domain-containing protein
MNLKAGRKNTGFTLTELMVVVAILALLVSLAVPAFLRGRKRGQASRVINDLRQIDSAVDQYALENHLTPGTSITTVAWTSYLKKGTVLYNTGADVLGNTYGGQTVDIAPKVPAATWNALSDVAGTDFFSPFDHQ